MNRLATHARSSLANDARLRWLSCLVCLAGFLTHAFDPVFSSLANVDQSWVSAILVEASCPLFHSNGTSATGDLNLHKLSLHEPYLYYLLSCPSSSPSAAYAVSLALGCSFDEEAFSTRPHGDNSFYPFFLRHAAYLPSTLHSPWSLLRIVPSCCRFVYGAEAPDARNFYSGA